MAVRKRGAVDVRLLHAAEAQDVLLGLLLNHVDHVVHGDDADEAPGLADHRRRHEVVLVEDVTHLLLVGLGGDRLQVRRHDVAEPHRAAGAEQPVKRDAPDGPVVRVDDVDLVEVVRHVAAGLAHVIDGLAYGPEGRQRDQLPLHQAAGAVLGVRQALRDAGPLLARDRVENLLALWVVQVLEDGDGIVALHVRDGLGGPLRADLRNQLLADLVLDMGKNVAAQHIVGDGDEAAALARAEPLDQIGDVGLVQGCDQRADPVAVGLRQRRPHGADKLGRQAIEPLRSAPPGLGAGLRRLVGPRHPALTQPTASAAARAMPLCPARLWASTAATAVMLRTPRVVAEPCST